MSKVYILIRNDYAMGEFDDDDILAVFTNRQKAIEQCEYLNSRDSARTSYRSTVYRVETYVVTE